MRLPIHNSRPIILAYFMTLCDFLTIMLSDTFILMNVSLMSFIHILKLIECSIVE